MLEFKNTKIQLGEQVNREKIPFLFEGKNNFNEKVFIETNPTCGCTQVRNKFWLEPKEEFKIEGTLSKRPKAGHYTKSIYLKAYDKVGTGRKQKAYIKLEFSVNVV